MVTVAQFTTRFPEWQGVDGKYILSHLNAAALEIDADVWGKRADEGTLYLAAHMMSTSPTGNGARLVDGSGSAYELRYQYLVRLVSSGYRVCG